MESTKNLGSADLSVSTKELSLPSNSTGIFSSIFPPPSKVMGRKASAAELIQSLEKQSSGCREWNKASPGHCTSSKEHESLFQDQVEPCPLSSAIFYGGQEDMYIKSSDDRKTIPYPRYKKEGREYDSGGNNQHDASRGNWWQGVPEVLEPGCYRFVEDEQVRPCVDRLKSFHSAFSCNGYLDLIYDMDLFKYFWLSALQSRGFDNCVDVSIHF
ncbi:uncharacterized protein LOC132052872 isoform X2 [Lycium ferocissimum]|uniref:uncharacterized protein LOC132052872 isoform X2 n=1 Tax=Lycium ferocissimum TaxID=112874 RepID=UPI002814C80F|nr:uncharacterized protein LOC132052872 isoform X2 [Lycium ferocissimum]